MADADPWIVDLTLAEVDATRSRNRARLGSLRFPLLGLAALQLCSAGWVLAVGRDHLAIFYTPGLLLVAALSGLNARRVARARGAQLAVYPWIVTAAVLLVLSATVSRWGFTHDLTLVEEIGPPLVFAIGILLFGIWGRNHSLTLAGLAMIAISLVSPLLVTGDPCVALQQVGHATCLIASAVLNPSTKERG
jgi:hypothetical protein